MVDVADVVASILVKLEAGGVFEFLEQEAAGVVLFQSLGVVKHSANSVVVGQEVGFGESHAVEGDVFCDEDGTLLLRVFLALAGTTVLERLLTSAEEKYK